MFLRKISLIAYTCAYAYVVITSPWHLTRGLVTVSHRYSTALCFHENCQLVVIISRVWDDLSPLFLRSQWWLNTINIGESLHNGDTKVSNLCVDMGIPFYWLRCLLQPFGIKTLSQAYALVRINPREVGWLSSFFSLWVKKYKWFHWKTFFCGLRYSVGLLELFHGQAISLGNTVWAVFLEEYPWRSQVALNPEVELLRCVCKGCSYIKA